MRPKTARHLTNEDIALAMELRSEKITWKYIAVGLGFNYHTVYHAVKKATKNGMIK